MIARAKKKGPERRGRKPTRDRVSVMALQRDDKQLNAVRFTLSENIVERLLDLHNELYPVYKAAPRHIHLRHLRLTFHRVLQISRAHVLIQAEPPSYDPRGVKVRRKNNGIDAKARRYIFEVRCRRIGLRPDVPTTVLETEWLDEQRGLIIYFPDGFMAGGSE